MKRARASRKQAESLARQLDRVRGDLDLWVQKEMPLLGTLAQRHRLYEACHAAHYAMLLAAMLLGAAARWRSEQPLRARTLRRVAGLYERPGKIPMPVWGERAMRALLQSGDVWLRWDSAKDALAWLRQQQVMA